MVNAASRVGQDVVPYMVVEGTPAFPVTVNTLGMRRNGVPPEGRSMVKRMFKILFRSGLNMTSAVERIRAELGEGPEVREVLRFIEEPSKRGIARKRQKR